MEVHYHPKHSDKARKGKEYLFEFLVIFIAITGSYFAENLREHSINRREEKEYMKSMLQDLKSDTTSLNDLILKNKKQLAGIDSLLNFIENEPDFTNKKIFYVLDIRYTTSYNGFIPEMRTIGQLMTNGKLGLIKARKVSDGILDYNNNILAVNKQEELLNNRYIKILEQKSETIDFLLLKRLRNTSSKSETKKYYALLTNDPNKIHAYYFSITALKGAIFSYNERLEILDKHAVSLITLINKEYNIKD
jgi:hypothetical protein